MASEPSTPSDVATEITIDVARLDQPDVAERRQRVMSMLVLVFRRLEHFLGERVCDAWDRVRRLELECAADITRVESRVTRVAVQVIDGTAPVEALEKATATYVLFWHRAMAALQLRELTCSKCRRMTESVAVRGHHAERLCLRCWKAATG
jgi:hypothetical protein